MYVYICRIVDVTKTIMWYNVKRLNAVSEDHRLKVNKPCHNDTNTKIQAR